jgi:hypothetical protein
MMAIARRFTLEGLKRVDKLRITCRFSVSDV